MKSVLSDVYSSNIVTETGDPVDMIFSFKSILNRIVSSPILIGTTTRLIRHASKKVTDIYFS
jgi:hypothetical protein